jgi:hypothetical protein
MSLSGWTGYWIWTLGFVLGAFLITLCAGGITRVIVGLDEDDPRAKRRKREISEPPVETIHWFDEEPGKMGRE